ncbi:MAG: periplasmic heavy metal sensor [Phycisphaerae bacterium]|nr:periplasmic heavy metal sensor [Phycisphaerae bacterium]
MMSRTNMAILVVSAVIGVTTFFLTRSSIGQTSTPTTVVTPQDQRPRWGRIEAMSRWLDLTDGQRAAIEKLDPTFWSEGIAHREQLAAERDKLAKLLEDPTSPDKQITDQVEAIIRLGNDMERRVTRHLLAVRKNLTPDQQKKLFGLAASGVRERMAWCDRPCGRGAGAGWGAAAGQGRGPAPGRGGRFQGGGAGQGRGAGPAMDGSGRGRGAQQGRGSQRGRGPHGPGAGARASDASNAPWGQHCLIATESACSGLDCQSCDRFPQRRTDTARRGQGRAVGDGPFATRGGRQIDCGSTGLGARSGCSGPRT